MIVEINEEQAEEILSAMDYCWNDGFPVESQALLIKIKEAFPDLWANYTYLESS